MERRGMVEVCWDAVGGSPGLVAELELTSLKPWLGGPLAVDELAVGAVSAGLLAAIELAQARGAEHPTASLSGEHVALSFQSERHARKGGKRAGAGFSALSQFFACQSGWVRTHGNYPHHARALARALEVDIDIDADGAAEAVRLLRRGGASPFRREVRRRDRS